MSPSDPVEESLAVEVTPGTWALHAIRSGGWAPLAVFGAHVTASQGFDAYRSLPGLDVPMHVLGGVAIAYFFSRSLRVEAGEPALAALTGWSRDLVVFALVCASTVFWEFSEWSTDALGATRAQGGLDDTMADMALGIAGGICFLVASRLLSRTPRVG